MKHIFHLLLLPLAFLSLSRGRLGHRTVALIAERHLSQKARQGIQDLLGNTALADVSTWADEVRNQEQYKQTGPWHYINLPAGLSQEDFNQAVWGLTSPNIYEALATQEQTLHSYSASQKDKITALKYIVHLIGDLHHPLHAGGAEDLDKNKMQDNYEGKDTNLHALWDNWLLEYEGLSDQALAAKLDTVSTAQIELLQNGPMLNWMWESYEEGTQLYKEVDAITTRTRTDAYYQSHIAMAEELLEKAGIRLAGVLNEIFRGGPINSTIIPAVPRALSKETLAATKKGNAVELKDVGRYFGKEVMVCGQVYGSIPLENCTLVNLGSAYPGQQLTVVLKGEARQKCKPTVYKTLCVKGKVSSYEGELQMEISKPEDAMML